MAISETSIQEQLDKVNAAINALLDGGAIRKLQLGEKIIEYADLSTLHKMKVGLETQLSYYQSNTITYAGL